MNGFYGTYSHSLDAKNRFFIPSKLREGLGKTFFITRKIGKRALVVYPTEGWLKLKEKIDSIPDSQVGAIKEYIYSNSAEVTPDSQGRILLPAELAAHAGIDRDLVLVGVSDYVLIYSAENWEAEKRLQEEKMEEMMQKLPELGL